MPNNFSNVLIRNVLIFLIGLFFHKIPKKAIFSHSGLKIFFSHWSKALNDDIALKRTPIC